MGDQEKKGWAKVAPDIRRRLGGYHSAAIEIAFNTGATVEAPPIQGLSPTITEQVVNLGQATANIRANPSEEEKKRWQGMTEEQIMADIEAYVRNYASQRGQEAR